MEESIIDFYNKESTLYSSKRYDGKIKSYMQYFFQRRLKIILVLTKKIVQNKENLTLLDIACADGIITQEIADKYSKNFKSLIGIDISPGMIDVARKENKDSKISFFLRKETSKDYFNIVFALGYLSGSILENEIIFAKEHLKDNGYYVCSLVSRTSIMSLLKLRNKTYYKDYWSYKMQEKLLKKHFDIIEIVPYGFFTPFLWKIPFLGNLIQPIFDFIFAFLPNLYQEKIYLLKNNIQ